MESESSFLVEVNNAFEQGKKYIKRETEMVLFRFMRDINICVKNRILKQHLSEIFPISRKTSFSFARTLLLGRSKIKLSGILVVLEESREFPNRCYFLLKFLRNLLSPERNKSFRHFAKVLARNDYRRHALNLNYFCTQGFSEKNEMVIEVVKTVYFTSKHLRFKVELVLTDEHVLEMFWSRLKCHEEPPQQALDDKAVKLWDRWPKEKGGWKNIYYSDYYLNFLDR